jgi:hypothetical protein
MPTQLISTTAKKIIVQVEMNLSSSMLESEAAIQQSLNEAGTVATEELLKNFDTDGSPIQVGANKYTSKGQVEKIYQTPYGEARVARHVYQTSLGGKTFCPLDQNARIVVTSTPKFAQQISHKFAEMASKQVKKDLELNHARTVARSYLQNVADAVGSAAQAKEEDWSYTPKPLTKNPIKTITVGLDGTTILHCDDGYRETMVGSIALYDNNGDRQHTTYIAHEPEYGKESFEEKLRNSVDEIKQLYPDCKYIGIADGAKSNWDFLRNHTETQTIDFYHVSEYLSSASKALYPKNENKRLLWLEQECHNLKHKTGAPTRILNYIRSEHDKLKKNTQHKKTLKTVITYFENNKSLMNYAKRIAANEPIGSGVTEAACKTIVKSRLCKSGQRWKERGCGIVLTLRTLSYSEGHWDQFWNKIDKYGFPVAA